MSGQDYPFIEHIVVDGLSDDETIQIVKNISDKVFIISEKDDGIYDAMNKGIRATSGDIIGILNSDDVYVDSNVISKIVDVFRDPSVQSCYADLQYADARDNSRITRTWKSGSYNKRSFYYGWMPPHPTFFVRKSVYDRVGLYNTSMRSAAARFRRATRSSSCAARIWK